MKSSSLTYAPRPLSTLTSHRITLLVAIFLLAATIALGTVYIQRNPALSTHALYASAEAAYLGYTLETHAPAPSGREAVSIPVLTYHRIVSDSSDVNNTTKSLFKDQMLTLKNAGWETVTLTELEEFLDGKRRLPEKSFVLTFDDGARESFYPVDPVLEALEYEAVNFVIVESSRISRTTYYLNPREIERMKNTGRWSIGSHSFDGHREFPVDGSGGTGIFFADRLWRSADNRLETNEEFRARVHDDLLKAKEALERDYGVPIQSFAFPLGNETGLHGANNFPEGSAITDEEARKIYRFGYLQLNNQRFVGNFPRTALSPGLADPFHVFRVHVDYDWDGKRVLSILENSLRKELPFEDDFSSNHGWTPSWGSLEIGRNNLALAAENEGNSASAFLDGTGSWTDYNFTAAVNWQSGHVLILSDVTKSDTYRACVFSEDLVRIQETRDGETRTIAEKVVPEISFGENVRLGTRVRGAVTECTLDFASVLEDYSRSWTGGIGIQTWDDQRPASLIVTSVIVRDHEQATP